MVVHERRRAASPGSTHGSARLLAAGNGNGPYAATTRCPAAQPCVCPPNRERGGRQLRAVTRAARGRSADRVGTGGQRRQAWSRNNHPPALSRRGRIVQG